ncbi:hypothetical protein QEV83_07805 [Methylocapsa sp. D3K7]|uniref:hypothetical protein n=1 Tax=Methylocapsa sp. D3K7 TaxID=3041435 RepID=UPI00244E8A29|nr:hypothetical protein [Methylocapsa sp. D3K7]WGJ16136.1 hypothetical protein QEV83_07805 [Methylocapsa sp. D3K7]
MVGRHWRATASNVARPFSQIGYWIVDFEMDYLMTPDDARKFVSSARRLRDGLDRYESMMVGLGTATDTVIGDLDALARAIPQDAIAVRENLDWLRGALTKIGNEIKGGAGGIREGSDGLSKIIRVSELEIRKGSN